MSRLRTLALSVLWLSRPRLPRKIVTGVVILTFAGILYGFFLWTLPLPRFWVSLTATSEAVRFRVINPDLALIHVSGMEAFPSEAKPTGCIAGVLAPPLGSIVEYRRGGDDYYRVVVSPPSASPKSPGVRFEPSSQNAKTIEWAGSVMLKAKSDCGAPPKRLPIWGVATYGDRIGAPSRSGEIVPGLLSDGTIEVYAHAQEWLLGLKFPPSIFSVQTFDLPPGAVLTHPPGAEVIWIGAATSNRDDGLGFSIRASTSSQNVALQLPNSPIGVPAQKISLGEYAQYLNDPNIVQIQFFFAVFIFLLQAVISVTEFFELQEQEAPCRAAEPSPEIASPSIDPPYSEEG